MLNAKQEQRNGTHIQKHQNSPKRNQRSEAAPLTLLALHLYSQPPQSKLSLRVGCNTNDNCQIDLSLFHFLLNSEGEGVFWGGCGILREAYTCRIFIFTNDIFI